MARGTLIVEVHGLRSERGRVVVSLYNRAVGFPERPAGRARQLVVPIEGRAARAVFEDLPAGLYAAIALHDENQDGHRNRNLSGLPREGQGMSGIHSSSAAPRSFPNAAFRFDGTSLTVPVEIHYIL